MSDAYFSPKLFKFLKDLKKNNKKEWFQDNKAVYEAQVKEPAQKFIMDVGPKLERISPHFVADPRKSLFRIYRDTRFSKDKTPYKTHVGIQFRHEDYKDAHAPGFYLHIEPGGIFVGIGTWHPDGATLKRIREAIVADPKAWKKASQGKKFLDTYKLEGDSLKRPPRGFDAEHPFIVDLKRKDFVAGTSLTQKEILSPDLLKTFISACRTGVPFVKFLCEAAQVPF